MTQHNRYILTISCPDVKGVVAAVTTFLAQKGGFILEAAQYGDAVTKRFFMRLDVAVDGGEYCALQAAFQAEVATPFAMDFALSQAAIPTRTAILVSKQLHCLNDLLHRMHTKRLPIEVPLIISNHSDARQMAEWHGIAFHHLPIEQGKEAQEAQIRTLLDDAAIDLVVLARYMQILSPELSAALAGKCINIHHSFLPSFKGARPYHQAHERGVKLIGATAHYVTNDLDEGPIIEQDVVRVDHADTPAELASVGHDTEALVLARAVRYHAEQRILLNGRKTVVFR
jgi:formyltetrahydrofolate deformylase